MKKVAIVGVEGSGKTVMLAGLGDLYTNPDENGYFLSPKNFGTASYVADIIQKMRAGMWPAATAVDAFECLDWILKKGAKIKRRPVEICEISFLDFAGEVYRAAFGMRRGGNSRELGGQADALKNYLKEADEVAVLINLSDIIKNGCGDRRTQEAMWITNGILDVALSAQGRRKLPRAAIVLSQADNYADTIEVCGGTEGVLRKYLPHVANNYSWLDIFSVSAVDRTVLDDDGNAVPARDFKADGLKPIMDWILEGRLGSQMPASRDMAAGGDSDKSVNAAYERGRKLEEGDGVPKNLGQAIRWYRKAGDEGCVEALCGLGRMYENGIGLKKDLAQAEAYYRKAADGGCTAAKESLCRLLLCKRNDDFGAKACTEMPDFQNTTGDSVDGSAGIFRGILVAAGIIILAICLRSCCP